MANILSHASQQTVRLYTRTAWMLKMVCDFLVWAGWTCVANVHLSIGQRLRILEQHTDTVCGSEHCRTQVQQHHRLSRYRHAASPAGDRTGMAGESHLKALCGYSRGDMPGIISFVKRFLLRQSPAQVRRTRSLQAW